ARHGPTGSDALSHAPASHDSAPFTELLRAGKRFPVGGLSGGASFHSLGGSPWSIHRDRSRPGLGPRPDETEATRNPGCCTFAAIRGRVNAAWLQCKHAHSAM